MRRLAREFLTYGAVSGLAFVADLTVLFLLVEALGLHYIVAAIAAFCAGIAVAYSLSVKFVFEYRRVTNRPVEFAGFAGIGAAGLLVNTAVLFVAVQWLHLHYLTGKLIASAFTFLSNYAARRLLLFTPQISFPRYRTMQGEGQ